VVIRALAVAHARCHALRYTRAEPKRTTSAARVCVRLRAPNIVYGYHWAALTPPSMSIALGLVGRGLSKHAVKCTFFTRVFPTLSPLVRV